MILGDSYTDTSDTPDVEVQMNQNLTQRHSLVHSLLSTKTRNSILRGLRNSHISQRLGIPRERSKDFNLQKIKCDHAFITFNIQDFEKQKFDLSDIFDEKIMVCKSLKNCIGMAITCSNEINTEEEKIFKRQLRNDFYYITICVKNKIYQFNDDNVSKYFNYCCREEIVPHFLVNFLTSS